ncbi:Protein O-mannosyltransferase 2, partial [Coemansia sp. RSA 551]
MTWGLDRQSLWNVIALTLISALTRFYKTGRANYVIFDEAHMAKFGAYYINATFYHDEHPQLSKMLIGLSEVLAVFDGSFTFPSGQQYPEDAGCLCVDNALCTISRFILLDAMLLFFTAMSALSFSGLYKHRLQPFTRVWWGWLFATGVVLGLVASSKWVGFFSVGLVGLYTVWELYDIFGQSRTRIRSYALHWSARIVALAVVLLAIYMLCFRIHFRLLYKSGPGDVPMDSLFQAGLQGTGLANQPMDIA